MSLDWDISKVSNRHEINIPVRDATPERRREWDITRWMIHLTVTMGTPTITEANWKNVYARASIIERLQGHPLLQWEGEEQTWFEPGWILRRVGLRTNAAKLSDAEFLRRVSKAALEERILAAARVEASIIAEKLKNA